MTTALIVVIVSVIVLDIVVITRAVQRIRVEGLKAEPLSLHDPRPRPPVAAGFRWLEPADAALQDPRSRRRGHERNG
jgi:hypothetical protein